MKRLSWRDMRQSALMKTLLGCLGGLAVLAATITVLLRYEPEAYRRLADAAVSGSGGEDGEMLARRALTKASAWHAALSRPGSWDAAVTAEEINAWLALDLPRNHHGWLPRGVSQPRIQFRPRQAFLASRLVIGPVTTVAWLELDIRLRDVNHLLIASERAGLGLIPLPRTLILRELARRIGRLGMATDLRMMDGRMVLMVFIPPPPDAGALSYRLESLAITAGELLVAGETRSPAERPEHLAQPAS